MAVKKVKFLDLVRQYESIKDEIDAAINDVLSQSAFVGGTRVKSFEASFANYLGVDFCVGVGSGTDALEIGIEALDLPEGSEVLVPANTFIATSEAVTRNGLKVVFCDIDPDTHLIALEDAKSKLSNLTSAIIPVHLYGQPVDMDGLMEFARDNQLKVVEDCAQAHGAKFRNKSVGSFGDIGIFSFYPGKNLGAYGDGGAIVCSDEELAEKCRRIANHGRIAKYDHIMEGRCSRLDGLQAAILAIKLNHLNEWTTRRRTTATQYVEALSDVSEVKLPVVSEDVIHVYHLFVIRTSRRDELKDFLANEGVQTGVHYPIALPNLRAYEYLNQADSCPIATSSAKELLSLPMGDHLGEEDVKMVVKSLKRFFE